jgi:hypothetical protein
MRDRSDFRFHKVCGLSRRSIARRLRRRKNRPEKDLLFRFGTRGSALLLRIKSPVMPMAVVPVMAMPIVTVPIVMMVPVTVMPMMMPVNFGQLVGIALHRRRDAGIAQRQCLRTFGRRGDNEQSRNCGKAE